MTIDEWLHANPVAILSVAILGIVAILYKLSPTFSKLVDAALINVNIKQRAKPKVESADPLDTMPIAPVLQVMESQSQALNGLVTILGPMVIEQKRANDIHAQELELSKTRQTAQEAVNLERTRSVETVIKAVQTSLEEIKSLRVETASAHLTSTDERNKHLELMNTVIADNKNALLEVATGVKKVETTNGDITSKIDKLEKQITDDILPMLREIQEQVKILVKRPGTGPLKGDPLITPSDPVIIPPAPVIEPAKPTEPPTEIKWPTHKEETPNV